MLYNSLILSYISYCNLVWATGAKTKIDPINLLQKKAIRICTGSQYLAHTNPLFNELKTLNVFHINSLQSLLFMFKYKNNLLPYSFHDFFTLNSTIHSYPTRNSPKNQASNSTYIHTTSRPRSLKCNTRLYKKTFPKSLLF